MTHETRRTILSAATAVLGAVVAGCLGGETDDRNPTASLPVASATLYHGPGCDCCGEYAGYLQEHLETDLEIVVSDDLAAVKAAHGIDVPLRSCHTVELDDYVVEGHVPMRSSRRCSRTNPTSTGSPSPGCPQARRGWAAKRPSRGKFTNWAAPSRTPSTSNTDGPIRERPAVVRLE